MAKLNLRNSCFNKIDNSVTKELKHSSTHKSLVKEANSQIEKNRIRYATAYNKSGSYLSN